jgi:hypothetical protein
MSIHMLVLDKPSLRTVASTILSRRLSQHPLRKPVERAMEVRFANLLLPFMRD